MKTKLIGLAAIAAIASLVTPFTHGQEEKLDLSSALGDKGAALKAETEEAGPGDNKRFTIRTDDNILPLEINDVYRNDQKTFFKIVEIPSKGSKGGIFVVERTAGSTDPDRKFHRVSGLGPVTLASRLTLLDIYLLGGMFMHPIALLGIFTIILSLNCLWIYRRKAQCPQAFVDASWKALQNRDLVEFDRLAKAERGLFPAICRTLTDRWETSTVEDIEGRAESVAATHINRLRTPVKTLNLIAAAAPLLGLLGTIVGMVLVFEAVAGATGAAKAQALAAGIRVKLFCTAAALTVAIPSLFAYFGFNQMLGGLISRCELLIEQFMHQVKILKRKSGGPASGAQEHAIHLRVPADGGSAPGVATAITDRG